VGSRRVIRGMDIGDTQRRKAGREVCHLPLIAENGVNYQTLVVCSHAHQGLLRDRGNRRAMMDREVTWCGRLLMRQERLVHRSSRSLKLSTSTATSVRMTCTEQFVRKTVFSSSGKPVEITPSMCWSNCVRRSSRESRLCELGARF
jgi:hypothetical protein